MPATATAAVFTPAAEAAAEELHLVSHHLCPYVQRAVIALTEKGVPFRRTFVDLAAKPEWFLALSPLGKTPVLAVGGAAIFESAVILEFLEETQARPLHPRDPLARARHRAWIEVGSAMLADIAGLYGARDAGAFEARRQALRAKAERLEGQLGQGPWFGGSAFSLVDAAFGPVFRYFDSFDRIADLGIFDGLPRTAAWRAALAARPSVRDAVAPDYPARLEAFLAARGSYLSSMMAQAADGRR